MDVGDRVWLRPSADSHTHQPATVERVSPTRSVVTLRVVDGTRVVLRGWDITSRVTEDGAEAAALDELARGRLATEAALKQAAVALAPLSDHVGRLAHPWARSDAITLPAETRAKLEAIVGMARELLGELQTCCHTAPSAPVVRQSSGGRSKS